MPESYEVDGFEALMRIGVTLRAITSDSYEHANRLGTLLEHSPLFASELCVTIILATGLGREAGDESSNERSTRLGSCSGHSSRSRTSRSKLLSSS